VQKAQREKSAAVSGEDANLLVDNPIPVFVITGFNDDNLAKHGKLLAPLGLWATEVSQHGLAQVIYVTNYALLAEQLSRNVANKVDSLELRDVDYKTALDVSCSALCASVCRVARVAAEGSPSLRRDSLAVVFGTSRVLVCVYVCVSPSIHPLTPFLCLSSLSLRAHRSTSRIDQARTRRSKT
jgi:hypothetical protein